MSQEAFESFRRLVLEDSGLQRALRDIDEKPAFVDRLITLAAERGFPVEADDVEAALQQSRREWLERWI